MKEPFQGWIHLSNRRLKVQIPEGRRLTTLEVVYVQGTLLSLDMHLGTVEIGYMLRPSIFVIPRNPLASGRCNHFFLVQKAELSISISKLDQITECKEEEEEKTTKNQAGAPARKNRITKFSIWKDSRVPPCPSHYNATISRLASLNVLSGDLRLDQVPDLESCG